MRTQRIKNDGEGYYHLVSRCCRQLFMFDAGDKDMFVKMMRRVAYFSGIEVMSYCVMDNHFHIIAHIPEKQEVAEDVVLDRIRVLYGDSMLFETKSRWEEFRKSGLEFKVEEELEQYRRRMGDVSIFMQCLKQRFSIWYSHHHPGTGTLWQGRFGSTLIEGAGTALSAVSAYIDLNPVRAGIVDDPKDYRWSGYGAAIDGDADAMQGLAHLYDENAVGSDFMENYAADYRSKLYLKGDDVFDKAKVEEVIKNKGKLPLAVLLRCKVRYFTRGTFFGSKEFVEAEFKQHRYAFGPKRKTCATGIGICENWNGIRLHSARRLQKDPVIVTA